MKVNLIKHIKYALYLIVFTGYTAANAGVYDDFFRAVIKDDASTIDKLLARGFDINTLDPQGLTGLALAIQQPSPKVVKVLIAAPKIDLNALNSNGESPLMLVALKGQLDIADQMVKRGADVNKTGWTPLHYAASTGQVSLISLLLENNAYIDAESPNQSTPLMMASMYGTPAAVKLLLDEGADPQLKNQQGLTALQFAQRANRTDIVALITQALRARQSTGKW